ncbi:heme a biosynthesis protein [Aspergillus luchuensis]|uniref:Heme a biosynthesis protein n=1 Tax=Aspergillus kawachii TaxID=1069201 RepID=A0A146F8L5_ASPKA|nr:heme a biosynthesis protein [Aspergillus luchuensis]
MEGGESTSTGIEVLMNKMMSNNSVTGWQLQGINADSN